MLLIVQVAGLPAAQDLEIADDGRERRRQLVRQVLHELVLAARRRPKPGVGRGQLPHGCLEPLHQRLAVFAQVAALLGAAHLLALSLEEGAELVGELLHVDGLLDVSVAADGKGEAAVAVAGQHDDGAAVEALVRAQPGGGLVTVDPGQLDVAEDQVRVRGDGQVDAGDAVRGFQHVEAARLEHRAHQRPAFRVVLDVEDARSGRKSWVGHR